jgi:hypothetical protein
VKDDGIRAQGETDEMKAYDAVEEGPDAVLEYLEETFPPLEPEPEESERDHST